MPRPVRRLGSRPAFGCPRAATCGSAARYSSWRAAAPRAHERDHDRRAHAATLFGHRAGLDIPTMNIEAVLISRPGARSRFRLVPDLPRLQRQDAAAPEVLGELGACDVRGARGVDQPEVATPVDEGGVRVDVADPA